MNYLHNHNNLDYWGAWSYRQVAGMTFVSSGVGIRSLDLFKNWGINDYVVVSKLKSLLKTHMLEYQGKSKWFKLFNRYKPFKLGKHTLSLCKYGYIQIDDQSLPFDSTLMYWILTSYDCDIDWESYHVSLRNDIIKCFKDVTDHIEQNYQKYIDKCELPNELKYEKLAVNYLSALTCQYLMQKDCPEYSEQTFFKFDRTSHIQIYHVFEDIINQRMNKSYTYAHNTYSKKYNERQSTIIFDTCTNLVNNIKANMK